MSFKRNAVLVLQWVPLGAALMLCWNTPLGYPIKISSVFCHEMSHALTAWALGVPVFAVGINSDSTGATYFLRPDGHLGPTKTFLIANAGYIGSVVCGGLMFWAAVRFPFKRLLSVLLGFGILGLAFAFRVTNDFGMLFSLAAAGALIYIGVKCRPWVSAWVLRIFGFGSCLYVIAQMRYVLFSENLALGDAADLYKLTHISPAIWETAWIILSLYATLKFLRWTTPPASQREVGSPEALQTQPGMAPAAA